jgi:predicted ATPase
VRVGIHTGLVVVGPTGLTPLVGETPQLFPVLWGLARFYLMRPALQTSRELGEQLLRLAQRAQDPALLLDALASVYSYRERFYEAELYRLKGDLLVALSGAQHVEAEACFRQALEVARHQQAKSLELRTATSLSRLWQRQGRGAEARQLLAEVYGWFTEGFDTPDLREVKALLKELS